jgi:hypothetical protein
MDYLNVSELSLFRQGPIEVRVLREASELAHARTNDCVSLRERLRSNRDRKDAVLTAPATEFFRNPAKVRGGVM